MSSLGEFPVIAEYKIEFNGEQVEVSAVELQGRPPEVCFFVHYKNRDFLLNRFSTRPDLWNGPGLSFEEAKMLGETIEEQTGYKLPPKPSNNPFKYHGDIKVNIESFIIGDTIIRRAKAPFTDLFFTG